MKQKKIYKFDCNCTYSESRVTIHKNRVKCPIHPKAKLYSRTIWCCDCGVETELIRTGGRKIRCDSCTRERHLKYCAAVRERKKLAEAEKSLPKSKVRETYCISTCPEKTKPECWECKDYRGIFKHDPKKLIEMVA